ncbi:MAG: hypothetical protein IM326_14160 [Microcystis sp. M020S1]|jgi:hypothetical protein|nr:hypothetical protein [Microcystis sp. M020S1]
MTRSAIFEPGSDLSKVRFEFDNNNQFPNLQETQATQATEQALTDLGTGLNDPNWFALRSYQYDLYTKILDAYINAVRETHQICRDLMPKSENVV